MAETDVLQQLGPNPSRKEILAHWEPENQAFWEKFGKKIANENLYTSTWALVLSFVVWTLWATIAAKLNAIPGRPARACRRDGPSFLYLPAGAARWQDVHAHHHRAAAAADPRPRQRLAGHVDVL